MSMQSLSLSGSRGRLSSLYMSISTRSSLRLNSSAIYARICCGHLSQKCLGHRLHNRFYKIWQVSEFAPHPCSPISPQHPLITTPHRCQLRGFSTSSLARNDSHCQGINSVLKWGWEGEIVPGVCEGEEGAGIPEGSKAGIDEDASASNESTSTSGEVSVGDSLLLSTSSRVNSASIRRISVEEDGMTSISLAGSWGTPTHRHNLETRTGKGRDICVYLDLIAISCETSSPRSIHLLAMIEPSKLGGSGATASAGATEGGPRFGIDSIVGGVATDIILIGID
ncbi:hypothetical protein H5410_003399 [Solanum commersonii]|uniref:Uncharacterized protein n=1 Tax=Solanum commersonii TaxID=4109 RepID=A0A9J6B4Z9_SOLCO|nr:hypothetical protein H5410_003399 [Solanum commersonii]